MYLTGWQEDVVELYGDPFDDVRNAAKVIKSWEKLAGGPWTNGGDSTRVKFTRTLVADAWQWVCPEGWPESFEQLLIHGTSQSQSLGSTAATQQERDVEAQKPSPESGPGSISVEQLIMACCFKRRFFITKTGRFGLGPAKTCMSDLVCVFPGSDVPFILMPPLWGSEFFFKGQAFVEGIMDYKGSLKEDLETNRITTREFLIS